MPRDFYDLLGVDKNAGEDEIKKAFREMVRDYHPDTSKDPKADEKFKTIQIARDVISEEKERELYDKYGHVKYVERFIDVELDGFDFTAEPKKKTVNETEEDKEQSTVKTKYKAENKGSVADIAFKPKISQDIIVTNVIVMVSTIIYFIGITGFQGWETDFIIQIIAGDVSPQISENIANVGRSLETMIAGLFVFLGIITVPTSIAISIYRYGHPKAWGYFIGSAIPPLILIYEYIGGSFGTTTEVAVYIMIPISVVVAYMIDIVGSIIGLYINYYFEKAQEYKSMIRNKF